MDSGVTFSVKGKIVYAKTVEGMDISKSDVDALLEFIQGRVEGSFAFIEIRDMGVSIDPMVYKYAREILPQVVVFALVTQSDLTFRTFEVESAFIRDMQFSIFRTLPEAEAWVQSVSEQMGE